MSLGQWSQKKMGLDLGCVLKVIPVGLVDRLTMGHEEREESKMTTRYFSWAAR